MLRTPLPGLRVLVTTAALALAGAPLGAVEVDKRASDTREYRYFELDNGLAALVISDPETDKAAASLDVHVGSASDPEGREGLAHFLEHMLFLGTEKYPRADEYKNFIHQHGGGDNAYTSPDHTNYFFNVDKAHLRGALDRFSQFFVAPRLDAQYVEREREVVHSEYTSKQRSDGRRIFYALKQVMNPEHPGARFAVGSRETLGDRDGASIRDDLLAFYRERYSANIMKLVVVGAEPVNELEKMVRERFADVPNHNARPQRSDVPRFSPGTLPARLDVKPLTERRSVSLAFPMPALSQHYRTKPLTIVADQLGHEGEGSLFATLKQLGLAERLSAGLGHSDRDSATFQVSIGLTKAGYEKLDEVISLFFDAVELVREEGIERWRYAEQSALATLAFDNADKEEAPRYAVRLASALHEYSPEDVLRGPYMMAGFDAAKTRALLDRVTPANLLLTVVAPEVDTYLTGEKFDVEYRARALEDETLARWTETSPTASTLALSEPNPFVPESFALLDADDATAKPVLLDERPGFALWHRQDTEFGVPRADFFVSVRSPRANDSARSAVLTDLFASMVNDELNAFLYPASQAGLEFSLYDHMRGVSMRISGYSDKQSKLLDAVLAGMTEPALSAERFGVVKARTERALRNAAERAPNRLVTRRLGNMLLSSAWSEQARLDALAEVSIDDLRAFTPKLFAEVDVIALSHGNTRPEDARALGERVHAALVAPAQPTQVPRASLVSLRDGEALARVVETTHADAGIVRYLQGTQRSYSERARFGLLSQVVSPRFFDVLRTEKNLGYVVYATAMPMLQVPGMAFIVQSPNADAAMLAAEIDAWLATVPAQVDALDEVGLERNRAALLSQLLARDTSLGDRTERYWRELDRGITTFDEREQIAEQIRAVTKASLATLAAVVAGDEARSLTVATPGKGRTVSAAELGGEPVGDVTGFKREHGRFEGT